MPPLPVNDSEAPKYINLSNQLATRILNGEWNEGRIPTVREIADAYGVSSFTASRALGLLQQRGLIVTKERSGCYARPGTATADTWGVVLRVTPGPWKTVSEAVSRTGFDRIAEEEKVRFVPLPLSFANGSTQAQVDLAIETATAADAAGVFFLPSRATNEAQEQDERFLAGCRRAGLPVVLVDRNLRGPGRPLEYDLVASDHFEGGRLCTRHLIDLGRRSIACVVASPTSSHADRQAGYLSALQESSDAAKEGVRPLLLTVPEGIPAGDEYGWLADRLIAQRVDAVVCYQDYTAVGLILELLRRGVAVPRDVAVVGCDDLPIGSSFSLGVTTYAYPAAEIARWALRLMRNRIAHPADPPVKVLLPGRLVVRNSTSSRG